MLVFHEPVGFIAVLGHLQPSHFVACRIEDRIGSGTYIGQLDLVSLRPSQGSLPCFPEVNSLGFPPLMSMT